MRETEREHKREIESMHTRKRERGGDREGGAERAKENEKEFACGMLNIGICYKMLQM